MFAQLDLFYLFFIGSLIRVSFLQRYELALYVFTSFCRL